MWSFFSLAVGMSLATYLSEGYHSFFDNILNTTDMVMVLSVTIVIYLKGDKSSRFNSFDKLLLLIVGLIFLFWIISKDHFLSNILIQIILVSAYIPVILRMIKSKENTEPFSVWILLLIAPIISLISLKGELAAIYAWRAIGCTLGLILLMLRTEIVAKKSGKQILVTSEPERNN